MRQLGVRFFSDDGDGGAEVEHVAPHSLAWRHGLAWGAVLERVRVLSARAEHEVVGEHELHNGYDAAKALRPAVGWIELVVRPRKRTPADRLAPRVQARWRGVLARTWLAIAHASATRIQASWRRLMARDEAAHRRHVAWRRACDEPDVRAHAAVRIQSHWRRYDAYARAYEQCLAIAFLQQHARGWLVRRRYRARPLTDTSRAVDGACGGAACGGGVAATRKRRRMSPVGLGTAGLIRAPPRLDDDDEEAVGDECAGGGGLPAATKQETEEEATEEDSEEEDDEYESHSEWTDESEYEYESEEEEGE